MPQPAIHLHNISKTFTERNWKTLLFRKPHSFQALKDINLVVEKGKIMGLLGPNGAGKTTLLKILATLITPDAGQGLVSGLDLCSEPGLIRHKIGMVGTNDRTFYWRLSGRDNLLFFATLYNLSGHTKINKVAEVLDLVDLNDKADSRFMTYSAGQRQRLAIARAMLSEPEILLMDEASTSLDPIAARKLISFTTTILAREQKKTIIWCTHNLTEAEQVCDSLTILHEGQIIKQGSLAEIKELVEKEQSYSLTCTAIPQSIFKHLMIENKQQRADGLYCYQVKIDQKQVPETLALLSRKGVNIYECSKIEKQLEEAFASLVC